jgi:integrating conjugative element protein (TIGR03761 family)
MTPLFDPEPSPAHKNPVPRTLFEQPGGLRNETRMTIQTRQAQKLVVGRKRSQQVEPIIGLLDFGRRMKLIWLSAEADDPYADWYLLKIEQALNESKTLIQEKSHWLTERLAQLEGFDIQIAESLQPLQVPIFFQNPYGYMGAYLVADYDALARAVFTARHIGLIDRGLSEQLLQITGKAIRRTFTLASQWKFTGITRDDIQANNPIAERAVTTFGPCPDPILNASQRAAFAPVIRTKPKVITRETSQQSAVPAADTELPTTETEADSVTSAADHSANTSSCPG